MKLKYYLRGLGTGIFVTAVILSVAFEVRISKLNSSMQNEWESHTEKQSETSPSSVESESISEGRTEEQSSSLNDKKTENRDSSAEESSDETSSSDKEETTTEPETASKAEVSTAMPQSAMVTLDIYSGMSSNKVAKRLEELGVVEDADDFNNYMYSQRVENSIRIGKFEIGQDATYDEIVAIITGR